jgi:hypothetical protein
MNQPDEYNIDLHQLGLAIGAGPEQKTEKSERRREDMKAW